MNDPLGLLLSAIGLVVVPVCLVRLVLGRADLAALYRAPGDGWPRGVQEGECPRWRTDESRFVAPSRRAPVPCGASAELAPCTPGDVAALEPTAERRAVGLAVGHVVQVRLPVHGRVVVAGDTGPRPRTGARAA
jgi:hypothetical protein